MSRAVNTDSAIKPLTFVSKRLSSSVYIQQSLEDVADKIERDAKKRVPDGEGDLRKSFRKEIKGIRSVEAGYETVYAMYQHQGRRKDGTHIILNRPAGGETYFLSKTIDRNLESYHRLFIRRLNHHALRGAKFL